MHITTIPDDLPVEYIEYPNADHSYPSFFDLGYAQGALPSFILQKHYFIANGFSESAVDGALKILNELNTSGIDYSFEDPRMLVMTNGLCEVGVSEILKELPQDYILNIYQYYKKNLDDPHAVLDFIVDCMNIYIQIFSCHTYMQLKDSALKVIEGHREMLGINVELDQNCLYAMSWHNSLMRHLYGKKKAVTIFKEIINPGYGALPYINCAKDCVLFNHPYFKDKIDKRITKFEFNHEQLFKIAELNRLKTIPTSTFKNSEELSVIEKFTKLYKSIERYGNAQVKRIIENMNSGHYYAQLLTYPHTIINTFSYQELIETYNRGTNFNPFPDFETDYDVNGWGKNSDNFNKNQPLS